MNPSTIPTTGSTCATGSTCGGVYDEFLHTQPQMQQDNQVCIVADDNDLNRKILERSLTRHGYSVISVSDGAALAEALNTHRFAICFFDNDMPTSYSSKEITNNCGLEIVQNYLQEVHPASTFCLVSAYDSSRTMEIEEICLRYGIHIIRKEKRSASAVSDVTRYWQRNVLHHEMYSTSCCL